MYKNLKEYFKDLERLDALKKINFKGKSIPKKIEIELDIMRLESNIFDFTYGIKHFLEDEERQYIKAKYIDKIDPKALEVLFNLSGSSLRRREKKILNRLSWRYTDD
ncbi:hypothetical protein IAI10_02585 [Clostridium sp. 19966]|uniref:hypothetical protein n=1 Tax=Clostridium sp. 19966 TaxID=2768166 RepID=UPI0028E03F5B|nr:hypothetical protein [Clostridium sp. 19966]MDT8715546.1 hypothetical protein [Clostridium sp. 19966]